MSITIFTTDIKREIFLKDKLNNLMDNIKDIYGHITDKIQKITAALYRVTDLLSDKEPLKWTLRDKALNLYDNLVSIKNTKDKDSLLDNSLKIFAPIVKSLELVSAGVGISNLNFEILKKKYLFLKSFIEGKKTDILYDSKMLLELSSLGKKGLAPFATGSENGQNIGVFGKMEINRPLIARNHMNTQEIDPQSRKGKILNFLKEGRAAKSVNEVAGAFQGGISEKTIQRDLLDLVKMGKISAIGDKRWRKYETIDTANRIS